MKTYDVVRVENPVEFALFHTRSEQPMTCPSQENSTVLVRCKSMNTAAMLCELFKEIECGGDADNIATIVKGYEDISR